MDARPMLVLALFASAALAGCTATAKSDVTDEAQDAVETAWEAARLKDADAQLLSIKGTEGEQWVSPLAQVAHKEVKDSAGGKDEKRTEPVQDAAGADMTWGDGLAASWEARFLAGGSVLTVRVYADGLEPVVTEEPAHKATPAEDRVVESHGKEGPKSNPSGPQQTDAESWEVGSESAAEIVAALPEFQRHVETYPKAGWAYLYVPYSAARPLYDWGQIAMSLGGGLPDLKEIGWSIHGNIWLVQHLDAAAIKADEVPTVATAMVDAATGKVLMVTVHVPRFTGQLLEISQDFQDPIPPAGLEPAVHTVPFVVPSGSVNLMGFLYAYGGMLNGPVGFGLDEVRLELVSPSGKTAYTTQGFGFGNELDIAEPEAGEWTLRITHDQPIPQSMHVFGGLYASVPAYDMLG